MNDDVVRRFIEYAYTGDYTHPNPDVVQLPADSKELQEAFKSTSSPRCDEYEWAVPSRMAKKDPKKKNKASAVDFGLWEAEAEVVADALEPAPINAKSEDAPSVQEDAAPALRSTDTDRRKLWISFCSQAPLSVASILAFTPLSYRSSSCGIAVRTVRHLF